MIKPCPFCGSADVHSTHVPNFSIAIKCYNCGSLGSRFELPDYTSKKNYELRLKSKAITAWNKRVNFNE